MTASMQDMPVFQAEDDGFLMHLKLSVLDEHLESLHLEGCKTLDMCVKKILSDSEFAQDKGGSLPLYIPFIDDNGDIQGSTAVPVWAGQHVDIPLYGDIDVNGVERLITGGTIGSSSLFDGFMSYSPAFRVALLVHHICQMVLMHPLAAEAYVLGRYEELPFEDLHFQEIGVPTTQLIRVDSNAGLALEWIATSAHTLSGSLGLGSSIHGWTIKVRGSQPKESWLIDAWQNIRNYLDLPRETKYVSNGIKLMRMQSASSGRRRKRVSDPAVDRLIDWIEASLLQKTFPMHGRLKNWKNAVILFDQTNPDLAGRWSADSMRKAYERRKRQTR